MDILVLEKEQNIKMEPGEFKHSHAFKNVTIFQMAFKKCENFLNYKTTLDQNPRSHC